MATVKSALHGKSVETKEKSTAAGKRVDTGLMFRRYFTDGKVSPFDAVEWEKRTALIGNEKGVTIFRQVLQNGQWVDTDVSPVTIGEIENKVLSRARNRRKRRRGST